MSPSPLLLLALAALAAWTEALPAASNYHQYVSPFARPEYRSLIRPVSVVRRDLNAVQEMPRQFIGLPGLGLNPALAGLGGYSGLGGIPQGFGGVPQGYGGIPQGYGGIPQGYGGIPPGYPGFPSGLGGYPIGGLGGVGGLAGYGGGLGGVPPGLLGGLGGAGALGGAGVLGGFGGLGGVGLPGGLGGVVPFLLPGGASGSGQGVAITMHPNGTTSTYQISVAKPVDKPAEAAAENGDDHASAVNKERGSRPADQVEEVHHATLQEKSQQSANLDEELLNDKSPVEVRSSDAEEPVAQIQVPEELEKNYFIVPAEEVDKYAQDSRYTVIPLADLQVQPSPSDPQHKDE